MRHTLEVSEPGGARIWTNEGTPITYGAETRDGVVGDEVPLRTVGVASARIHGSLEYKRIARPHFGEEPTRTRNRAGHYVTQTLADAIVAAHNTRKNS